MKRWTYTPSPLLDKTLAERLTTFPRDPTLTVYGLRFAGMLFLKALFAVYFRLRIVGRSRIPKSGPFVLVANHSSHLDAVALACALPVRQWHHAYAAAAQDYFFHGVFRSFIAVVFTNAVPFDRHDDPKHSLELCAPFLDHRVVEMALAFPFHQYMKDGLNKAILRRAAAGVLAPEVLAQRRKFVTPGNNEYLIHEVLRPEFLQMLESRSFYDIGIWSHNCKDLYLRDLAQRARPAGLLQRPKQ
jgi:hypothetical protein